MARENRLAKRNIAALLTLASLQFSAHSQCNGVELHAHRGHFSHPENTEEAVFKAFDEGFDAAEIDIQLLADKKWVLHHDPLVGRVIKAIGHQPVSTLTSQAWKNASVMDRQGNKATEKPAFFHKLLNKGGSSFGHDSSKLNIEIKGKYQCEDIWTAANLLQKSKFASQSFFTSIDMGALRCLREIDSNKYLGVIVAPEISSIQTKSTTINSLISTLKLKAPEALRKAEMKYDDTLNRNKLTESEFKRIKNAFGNVGIHMDASSLLKQQNLIVYAREIGLKLLTYSSLGDKKHVEIINLINGETGLLPDGMIVDGDAERVCASLSKSRK